MNIAVFLPNWIGDAVMATPAIRALRQQYPQAHFTGILKPYVSPVYEGLPWFDSLIYLDSKNSLDKRWPYVAWKLRKSKPHLAILFPNSFRSAWVAWLAGSKRIIGYARYCRRPLLTTPLEPLRDSFGNLLPSPIIDAYNLIAEKAGCPAPGYRMELATTAQDDISANNAWQKLGLGKYAEVICLNPGAGFGSAKYWPTEYFAALSQQLLADRDCAILILCGPKEKELARTIVKLANRKAVVSLADQPLSLGLTKACIQRCNLLITTDSGPRHFAVAFQKPVVSLFGPTHIPWTITYHPQEICLQKEVPCGPCQLRVCPVDHRCMKELTPQEVFMAANRLLSKDIKDTNSPGADRKAS